MMSYRVVQMSRFAKTYKRLRDNQVPEVDAAVALISENPSAGDRKKGDLSAIRVFKFKVIGQEFLLAYSADHEIRLLYLEALGSHENFYRDLKN